MRPLLVLVALFFSLPARAVTIDWVAIGNANNLADTPSTNCYAADCGSVDHAYYISKYEVTNAQYAEFLNAKAASDPLGLYHPSMGTDGNNGGITRSGSSDSYTYTVKAGFANKPVTYIAFWDALRFANWMQNGQANADTETGAYAITAEGIDANSIMRNPGAGIFLPSENEWYKAAYYDGASATYFDHPAGTDTATACSAPTATANRANCGYIVFVTDVGAYTGSASPYGTFDQGGNVWEWNEEMIGSFRGLRGGSWIDVAGYLAASYPERSYPYQSATNSTYGFRIATLVPEPGPGWLGMTAVLGLAASRRRRAN
jgi:MYXO-CTERM domain-containing protein